MQLIEERRRKNRERMRVKRADKNFRKIEREKNKIRMREARQDIRYKEKENAKRRKNPIAVFFQNIDRNIFYKDKKIISQYARFFNRMDNLCMNEELKKIKIQKYHKEYNSRPDVKKRRKEYHKEYYQKNKRHLNKYSNTFYKDNQEWYKQYYGEYYKDKRWEIQYQQRQYRKTDNGKTIYSKAQQRRNERYKDIPLIMNIFPSEVEIEYHHILNDFHSSKKYGWFVIPMPKITHNYIAGRTKNREHWRHNAEWINKLYCINIKELLRP